MRDALALAANAIGLSDPNPRVGCVIVGADGTVLGRGFTQEAGGPHAEIVALRDAAARGADVRGATVHVTLEPCSHHGRTPPCADALVAAGVGRVVIAMRDPNPLVAGQGAARLAAAGIAVAWGPGADEARELNIGFVSRMERGRPWLRMKVADLARRPHRARRRHEPMDHGRGRACRRPRMAQARRRRAHRSRHRARGRSATRRALRRDDAPAAARRSSTRASRRRPTRASSRRRGACSCTRRSTTSGDAQALEARGAEIAVVPSPAGKVDLAAMLADLGRRGINELHVEAGEKLNASLLAAGLVDELLVYVAPRLVGSGRGLAALGPIARLDEALGFAFTRVDIVGDDLRLMLRPRTAVAA